VSRFLLLVKTIVGENTNNGGETPTRAAMDCSIKKPRQKDGVNNFSDMLDQ
jgi:hypothetical protein